MHQQVRTSTTKTGAGSRGPGAMADEGSLVDILTQLRDGGFNLQAAGGRDLDGEGEFVFAVHHGEKDDDRPGEEAAALLRDQGYAAEALPVHHCVVSDETGSLLDCINEATELEDAPVYEIFVGTSKDPDRVPIQVTTRKSVARREKR